MHPAVQASLTVLLLLALVALLVGGRGCRPRGGRRPADPREWYLDDHWVGRCQRNRVSAAARRKQLTPVDASPARQPETADADAPTPPTDAFEEVGDEPAATSPDSYDQPA